MPWFNEINGSLRYELRGEGKPTLILCHELGGSLESWSEAARLLQPHFRILLWDQRGAGLSEKIVEARPLERHADDLERLVAALGLRQPYYV